MRVLNLRSLRATMTMLVATLTLSGCDSATDTTEVKEKLNQLLERTEQKLEGLGEAHEEVSGAAAAEMNKLFNFEYKVLPLPHGDDLRGIEASLNEAGQDRWDCFQVLPLDSQLAVLCKRHPKTPLRYIPRIVP